VLGPLTRGEFDGLAPRGACVPELIALVRGYAGDALCWDVRLKLKPEAPADFQLGVSVLGQTSWLSAGATRRAARRLSDAPSDDLIFDPQASHARGED
jgi:type VI secretion system protein ImpH